MKRAASVGIWIANIVGLLLLLTVANDGYAASHQAIVQHAPILRADAAAGGGFAGYHDGSSLSPPMSTDLPAPQIPNVRAPRFAVITGHTDCWKCHASTKVSALVLDAFEEQDPEYGDWSPGTDRMMLQRITEMSEPALEQVRALAPWMKPGFSRTADAVYLANHCTHCDALQGEWFLTEPGAVFFPSDGSMPEYEITVFDVPLEAEAGGSVSSWLDELRI